MLDLGLFVTNVPIGIFQGLSFPSLMCMVLVNTVSAACICSIAGYMLAPKALGGAAGLAPLVFSLVSAVGVLFGYSYIGGLQVVLALSAGVVCATGHREGDAKTQKPICGPQVSNPTLYIALMTFSPILAMILVNAKTSGLQLLLLPSWCLYLLMNIMVVQMFWESEQIESYNNIISFLLPTSFHNPHTLLNGVSMMLLNAIQYGYLFCVPHYLTTCKGLDSLHAIMLFFLPFTLSLLGVQLYAKNITNQSCLWYASLLLITASGATLYFTNIDEFTITLILQIIIQTCIAIMSHSLALLLTKSDTLKSANSSFCYYLWNFLGAILGLSISLCFVKFIFNYSMEQNFLVLKSQLPVGFSIGTLNILKRKAFSDPNYIYREGIPPVVLETVSKAFLKGFQYCFLCLSVLSLLLALCCAFAKSPAAKCSKSDLA